MKKGYRYNNTIQFSNYQRQVANFNLAQQALNVAKQVPGAVAQGAQGMLRGAGNMVGNAVSKPAQMLKRYGSGMAKAGQQGNNGAQMMLGQGLQAAGKLGQQAGVGLKQNAALTGGLALGAGGLAAGAGANAMMNRNQQPGMY